MSSRRAIAATIEWGVLGSVLVLCNAGLAVGLPAVQWTLAPEAVLAGEWWRVLLHPFVHVSRYHALLDVGAFVLLWQELMRQDLRVRLSLLVTATCGAALAALTEPAAWTLGYCGLSGVGHGLMAFLGADLWRAGRDRAERVAGGVVFMTVVVKSLLEAMGGQPAFAGWHMGDVGTPNPLAHLGGVLAGCLCAALYHRRGAISIRCPSNRTIRAPTCTAGASPRCRMSTAGC